MLSFQKGPLNGSTDLSTGVKLTPGSNLHLHHDFPGILIWN